MKASFLATLALAAAGSAEAASTHKARPDCGEVDSGACQCENGDQIDEYRADKYREQCFLGNDAEGNPKKFSFYPWLEQKHGCPVVGEIAAAKLQQIWAQGQECWADQNPCDALPGEAMQEALGQCGDAAAKNEVEEEVNGEEEATKAVQPKDPKLERGQPPLKEALATGKGSNIFTEPTPFDKKLSTEKSILDALWADKGEAAKSLGSVGDAKDGSIHFSSSASGATIKDEQFENEARYLTTKEFDVKGGGVVEYYVRYNDPEGPPGGEQCKTKVDAMLAEFARQKRCEDEKKAKEACELSAAQLCNGHGKPVYESGCSVNNVWKQGADNTGSHNNEKACDKETAQFKCNAPNLFGTGKMSKCDHCICEPSFEGAHCTRSFKNAPVWSRSVGDPHPRTFNGLYTNIYDEGEFIWWRHPVIPMEAHLVTTPRSSVAINKAFSVKRCKGVDDKQGRFDQAGNKCTRLDCYPKMVGPCEVITRGDNSISYSVDKSGKVTCGQLRYGCLRVSGHTIYNNNCNEMAEFNGAEMRLKFGSGTYKDSYLWVKSLNDGAGGGIGGHWGGSDYGDTISRSGTRGSNRMYSETFYDRYRIKKKENSHWGVCGTNTWRASMNYRRSLIEEGAATAAKGGLRANKAGLSKAVASTSATTAMFTSSQMFSNLHFKAEALNAKALAKPAAKLVGDCDPKDEVEGNTVCSALATKWCTVHIQTCSGLATPDAGSLVACVKDMVKVGNTAEGKAATLKLACDVVKEDFDVAIETAVEEAKEVKQELASAWPLLLPEPTDLVLQWCAKDCDAKSEPDKCLKMRSEPAMAIQENKEHPVKAMNKACGTGEKGTGGWHTFKAVQMNEYGDEIVQGWKRFTTRVPEEAVAAAAALNGNKLRVRFYQHSHKACFCCNALAIDQIRVQTGGWPIRIIADDKFELYADGKIVGDGHWAKRENSIDVNRFRVPTDTRVIGIYVSGAPKARDGRSEETSAQMSGVLASIADSLVTSASWSCTSVGVGESKWRKNAATREFKDWLTWPYAAEMGSNDPGTDPWGQIPGIAKSARWIYTHMSTKKASTEAFCRIDTDHAWLSYSEEHVTATRWSCKNREDLQSAFVVALNSDNSRQSFPGMQVATQDRTASFEKSNAGWMPIMKRVEDGQLKEQRSMVLRLKLKEIMDKAADGALVKVATLRLYTTADGVPLSVCNLATDTKAGSHALQADWKTVSYATADAATKTGCITVTSVKDDFVKIDVSNWVRGWRTNPKTNVGLYITTTSKEGVNVAAPDMPAKSADLRPRLSLSCHGDQADPTLVFKSKAATTLRRAGESVSAKNSDSKVDAETAGANFDEVHNRGKVNAPWPKGLKDVSWLEGAKLDNIDWGHKR